jgi:AcrR family transcriptional regulator
MTRRIQSRGAATTRDAVSRKGPARAAGPLTPGRREVKKQIKLEQIRRAARDVFLRKGFAAATVREIAAAAGVAFGTLFLYAKDKQDLLLLLFDEELPALTTRAFGKAKAEMQFVEQLLAFFTEVYAFFMATPQLSRDMMRENTFSGGIVATRILASAQNTERQLARLVARAQADGQVSSSIAPDVAAHLIFSIYRIEIRFCVNETHPDVSSSLARLRREFEVLYVGLEPRAHDASAHFLDRFPIRTGVGKRDSQKS